MLSTSLLTKSPCRKVGFTLWSNNDDELSKPLLEDVAQAGFKEVEINCCNPSQLLPLIEVVHTFGLEVSCVATGRWHEPVSCVENPSEYALDVFNQLTIGAEIVSAVDAKLVIGLARGPSGLPEQKARTILEVLLLELVMRHPKLKILLEPICPEETCWPHSIHDANSFVTQLGLEPVSLLLDSYHAASANDQFLLEEHLTHVCHVHIRDIVTKGVPAGSLMPYLDGIKLWVSGQASLSFEIESRGQQLGLPLQSMMWLDRAIEEL